MASEEQALRGIAVYPTESCVEMTEVRSSQASSCDGVLGSSTTSDDSAKLERALTDADSPVEVVPIAIPTDDDQGLPVSTIRAWTIGLSLTAIFGGLNLLFQLRSPPVRLSTYIAQIMAYGLGRLWDRVMPEKQFSIFGFRCNLRPGFFNHKELTLITAMANVSFAHPVGTFYIPLITQRLWYHQNFGLAFEVLFALSLQLVGFGLAGFLRTLLVYPTQMVYPEALLHAEVISTLHGRAQPRKGTVGDDESGHGKAASLDPPTWSISKYQWLVLVVVCSFIWYWFPGVLFTGLSSFTFITWMWPESAVINQLFGTSTGLSLVPLTFDWVQVTGFLSSPLIPPWNTIWNTLIGVVLFFIVATPAVHFSGLSNSKYLPIWDLNAFDNTQKRYDCPRVLQPDLTFDEAQYRAYSPIFLSAAQRVSYGTSFAALPCTIVQMALFHGKDVWRQIKDRAREPDDVHVKSTRKYSSVPWWWFGILSATALIMSFCAMLFWQTHLPWWGLSAGFLLAVIFVIPAGMLYAMTQAELTLHIVADLFAGYVLPGRPLAMMLFKAYGCASLSQALQFSQDLKLGIYMKVPSRPLFWAQIMATLWCALVQLGCLEFLVQLPDICTQEAPYDLTCRVPQAYYTGSIIWGVISPGRVFGSGAMYSSLNWFWLLGASAPVLQYLWLRRYPDSRLRYINPAIIFSSLGAIPAATLLNYFSWGFVGWFFQKFIHDRHNAWWNKYRQLTSAGLDVGTGFAIVVVVLGLGLSGAEIPKWWGNVVPKQTMDIQREAFLIKLATNETFGPKSWL